LDKDVVLVIVYVVAVAAAAAVAVCSSSSIRTSTFNVIQQVKFNMITINSGR
jgi:hypothetical protein